MDWLFRTIIFFNTMFVISILLILLKDELYDLNEILYKLYIKIIKIYLLHKLYLVLFSLMKKNWVNHVLPFN